MATSYHNMGFIRAQQKADSLAGAGLHFGAVIPPARPLSTVYPIDFDNTFWFLHISSLVYNLSGCHPIVKEYLTVP